MKTLPLVSQADNLVTIGNVVLEGYVSHFSCAVCGTLQIFSKRYDNFFCPFCNTWLENKCSDPNCPYCAQRPARPLPE